MASISEIDAFLRDFKFKLGFWGLLFQNRLDRKNFQTMTDLELQVEHVKEILGVLECSDYCEGPMKDILYKGSDMWVFGQKVKKREVYIKITIGQPRDKVICISFHFASYELSYPYKAKSK
jgi:hypothetical protein